MAKVSVIIPTLSDRSALLEKLLRTLPPDVEVVIEGDAKKLLAAKRNSGAHRASGEYLFFVDDDNYLEPGALEEALKWASMPGVGIVGFMACYDDKPELVADGGSDRHYVTGFMDGVNTNKVWEQLPKGPYIVDEVANAFVIHADLFYELHGFDEKNFPIDLDEADLCKRVKDRGLDVFVAPLARCYHKSVTYSWVPDFRRPRNAYFMGRNRVLYQKKHLPKFELAVYMAFFLPIFYLAYCACLLSRRKPGMIVHFSKGVFDGIFGRFQNQYQ